MTAAVVGVWVAVALLAGRSSPHAASTFPEADGAAESAQPGPQSGQGPAAGFPGGGRGVLVGTVRAVHGATITLATSTGTVTVVTSADTAYTRLASVPLAAIKAGDDVIASATAGPDNATLVARAIVLQPAGSATAGGRQSPAGRVCVAPPGAGATGSASADGSGRQVQVACGTVTAAQAGELKITGTNGTTVTIVTPASTPVTERVAGIPGDLEPQEIITVRGAQQDDGSVLATRIEEGQAGFATRSGAASGQ